MRELDDGGSGAGAMDEHLSYAFAAPHRDQRAYPVGRRVALDHDAAAAALTDDRIVNTRYHDRSAKTEVIAACTSYGSRGVIMRENNERP